MVIGLATGVNAALFGLIDFLLLRPVVARSAHELRYIYSNTSARRLGDVAYRDYLYIRDHLDALDGLAASGRDVARIADHGAAFMATGEVVTQNYFDVLGVAAVHGRTFLPGEDKSDSSPAVVIGEALWRNRFGADPTILGKHLRFEPRARGLSLQEGQTYTVVGVIGAEFRGLVNTWEPAQYWLPLSIRATDYACDDPSYLTGSFLVVFGRVRAGILHSVTDTQIAAVAAPLRSYRSEDPNWSLVVTGSRRADLPFSSATSVVPARLAAGLMLATAIVLLVATTNLIGMLMARALARRAEVAVRLMLGARPRDVVCGVFAETALLSLLGGVLGLLLARFFVAAFLATVPTEFGNVSVRFIAFEIPLDTRMLMVTGALCILVSTVIGLPPALQLSRSSLTATAQAEHVVSSRYIRLRFQRWILLPQISLSVMLLLLAGVLMRTLLRSELATPGYEHRGLAFVQFDLAQPGRCERGNKALSNMLTVKREQMSLRIHEAAKNLPEVEKASLAFFLPPDNRGRAGVITREEYAQGNQPRFVSRADVSPDYFSTLQIKLLRGRDFDARDGRSAPKVAIVSAAVAEMLWPGRDPLAQTVGLHEGDSRYQPQWAEVVGIVGDVAPAVVKDNARGAIYLPTAQGMYARSLVARYRGSASTATEQLLNVIRTSEPDAEVIRTGTVDSLIGTIRYPHRLSAILLAIAGLSAVFVASIGLYGLLSYLVTQRVREIGVRAALGAQESEIKMLITREGVVLGFVGAVIGAILAFSAIRVTSHVVVELPSLDPITVIVVYLVIGVVVLLSCYLPARRAAQVDPAVVLRRV